MLFNKSPGRRVSSAGILVVPGGAGLQRLVWIRFPKIHSHIVLL